MRTDLTGRVVQGIVAEHGRLDAVVANAGEATPTPVDQPVAEAAVVFDRMITANTRSAFVTVRAALPQLVVAGGDVVLVSTDHVSPRPGSVPKAGGMESYDAAKWALEGLRRSWAATLARHRVRVNTIAMGETDTPMLRGFLAARGVSSERIEAMAAGWLRAMDVAGVIVDLLADTDPRRTDTVVGLWPGFPVELPALPT